MKIVLIVMDTLRADHLGCYGYLRDTTPHLDGLAADGLLFERCLSQTAHTMPTFTTIMTGQTAFTHGIVGTLYAHPNEPDQILDDTHPLLAQQFRNTGTLTAAFDNLLDFGCIPKWFAQGYDFYVNTAPLGKHCSQVLGEQINERLIPWLHAYGTGDYFLFVHYWDAHQAYNQPEPFRSIHQNGPRPERIEVDGRGYYPRWGWEDRLPPERIEHLNLYDGDISYGDMCVGQVLDTLREIGAYDDAWVFFTADHGEDLEQHNAPFEHREPYESTCGVPLIAKPPAAAALAPGTRIKPMVGHIDLMPTILELASLDAPEGMDGTSLVPLMHGKADKVHDYLPLDGGMCKQDDVWICPEVAVTDERWKLLRRHQVHIDPSQPLRDYAGLSAPRKSEDRQRPLGRVESFNALPQQELYDVEADPDETVNVEAQHPEHVERLGRQLDAYLARNPRRWGA